MTGLILYIMKSTVYLSVFYLFFMLVMRRTTFFKLNRVAFLVGTLVCLILPFINISLPGNINPPLTVIVNAFADSYAESMPMEGVLVGERGGIMNRISLWELIFGVGAVVSFLITARSYFLMVKMMRMIPVTRIDNMSVKIADADIPSFSWGRSIVISRKDFEGNPAILTHEMMHIRCSHSIDLMLYTLITTLYWFNPVIWIARRELKMLHEYEADEYTINNGIDPTQYQLVLVKKAVGTKRFQLANGFNHSKLINRITMMHKNKTNKWMGLAYLVCIPILGLTMCFCSQPKDALLFADVDEKPMFEGSDANAFAHWVSSRIEYPQECVEAEVSGRVALNFTIGTDGKVTDVKVLKGVHEKLDAEVVRVVKMSPKWTPGKHEGKPVPVSFTFPVVFQLRNSEAVEYQQAQVKPIFKGGDLSEFSKWVYSQIEYPKECVDAGVAGRVMIGFTVGIDGKLTDVKVLRGVHEKLDAEAVRVIGMSPEWTPGANNGEPVPVSVTFPLVFKLQ